MSKFDKETNRNQFFYHRDSELDQMINPKTGKMPNDLMEKINCRVCASPDYEVLFIKNGFGFVRCNDCGLVYVNPQLKEKAIIKYYSEEAPSHETFFDIILSPKQIEVDRELYRYYFEKIKKTIPNGKILDIGCSVGVFLGVGREYGYETVGLELNEKAAEYAEKSYGITVRRELLEDCKFPDNSFDVVSMFGVVEHLPRPIETFKEIQRVLKPGGMFVGRCPNAESLAVMILHGKARTFTGRNHLGYFSPRTLALAFEKSGFSKSEIDTCYSGMDSMVNHLQLLDPFDDKEDGLHLPPKFKEFLLINKKAIEEKLNELGIGLKLRFFATK